MNQLSSFQFYADFYFVIYHFLIRRSTNWAALEFQARPNFMVHIYDYCHENIVLLYCIGTMNNVKNRQTKFQVFPAKILSSNVVFHDKIYHPKNPIVSVVGKTLYTKRVKVESGDF